MELFDPRTFLLVANLLGLLCALVLWVQARSFPGEIEGLGDWARAVGLIAFASGLSALRGILPSLLTVVLSSALFLFGQLWMIVGLQRYCGRPVVWRPALDIIGALLIVIVWLTYGSHHYQGRLFLMALAHIVFSAFGTYLAWQAPPRGFGSRFLSGFFMLGLVVAVYRIATLPSVSDQIDDLFDHGLIQQLYLGFFSLGVLGLSIGFILVANERLRVDLEFMATRDPMTGALNRRAFFGRAEVEWARRQRTRQPLAAITSDIDFFKKVNDTHGHHVGDLVIKDFCRRTGQMLRIPDVLARFGGEEFVILLPDTGLAEAKQVAERIRKEIQKQPVKGLPTYTVSLGVAVAQAGSDKPESVEALLAVADQKLYQAKERGRNRVEA
ncbi:MAG: GGDEF domain-containing protein [Bacteroidota bacterium]